MSMLAWQASESVRNPSLVGRGLGEDWEQEGGAGLTLVRMTNMI